MDIITNNEKERRWKKIRESMEKQGLESLIVFGTFGRHRNLCANLRYLCNVPTEGYLVFPLKDEPTLFTFLSRMDPKAWVTDWRCGHPVYSKVISERLRELRVDKSKIGIVELSGYSGEFGFPQTTYASLLKNHPEAQFVDATYILDQAMLIKSDAEIKCLELGCEIADKVIEAIICIGGVGVPDYEIRATIMDTLFREGCEPGSMLLFGSGKEISHAGKGGYAKPPDKRPLEKGDVILTEFDASYYGYLAQYNQPFSVGEPDREWRDIFEMAVVCFSNGIRNLKPGITAGDLDKAFTTPIVEAGYIYTHPTFHGIGLKLEEPIGNFPAQPEYRPNPNFILQTGMVLEFEPQVVTSDVRKGLSLGIPVLITDTGCRLLSKTWKPEFKIV
ncbi:M24 family metallopeptidase [Chloroflexota bacterium]